MKKQLIEGVYDPGILKAVFLAGGPGAGKSVVIQQIFGTIRKDKKSIAHSLSATGLKVLSSDVIFEKMLKELGIDPKNLHTLTQQQFKNLTVGDESVRAKAKNLLNKIQKHYVDGRLGIIYDGTGQNLNKINRQKELAEQLGYDTYMIFVDTSLNTTIDRNNKRKRQLPRNIVVDLWYKANKNKITNKKLFGKNFISVNNDQTGSLSKDITNKVKNIITTPVKNPIGKMWIKTGLAIKNKLK